MTRVRLVPGRESGPSGLLCAIAQEASALGADVQVAKGGFASIEDVAICVFSASGLAQDARAGDIPSARQLERSIAICTERPASARFEPAAAIAARAGATMDISEPALAEHHRRGTVAERFSVGYSQVWDRWAGSPGSDRAIDVLFTGSLTDRRESVLGASAEPLARSHFCVMADASAPQGEARLQRLRASRTVLAVHEDSGPYFDWLLALPAICNGAVLISEHACDFGPLVPGEHFVSARPNDLGLLSAQLLRDESHLTQMRHDAHDFVRERMTLKSSVERLLVIAETMPVRSARRRSLGTRRHRGGPPASPGSFNRLPPPARPSPSTESAPGAASVADSDGQLRFLGATPVYWQSEQELSVCVAPCDATDAVSALENVARTEGALPEVLLVVESTAADGWEPVAEWLVDHLWLPVLVLGVPVSRALAADELLERIRSRYVLMMEAQDALQPSALELLRSALERDQGAASAHGLVDHRSAGGTGRLVESVPWELSRFHGEAAPDRLALVRREATPTGGWACDDSRRVLVPQILCRSGAESILVLGRRALTSSQTDLAGREESAEEGIRPEGIVWIFGFGRTGSSWLRALMVEPDGHQLWEEPLVGRLFGTFYEGWDADDPRARRRDFVLGTERRLWTGAVRAFVLERINAQFSAAHGSTLIVKEPNGSIGAPLLMEALPESRMVLLVRDPRDVMASAIASHKSGGWAREAFGEILPEDFDLEMWCETYVSDMEAARRAYDNHRGAKVLLRYEDLRADPVAALKRCYSGLALSVDDDEILAAVDKHSWENIPADQKGPGKFNRRASPGGWRDDLTTEQVGVVERITARTLEEFYGDAVAPPALPSRRSEGG